MGRRRRRCIGRSKCIGKGGRIRKSGCGRGNSASHGIDRIVVGAGRASSKRNLQTIERPSGFSLGIFTGGGACVESHRAGCSRDIKSQPIIPRRYQGRGDVELVPADHQCRLLGLGQERSRDSRVIREDSQYTFHRGRRVHIDRHGVDRGRDG